MGEITYPTDKIVKLTQNHVQFISQLGDEELAGVICHDNLYDELARQLPENTPILKCREWQNAEQLDRFLLQLYTQYRLKQLMANLSHHQIIQFHSRHKYLLMAYSPQGYQLTGKWVAAIQKNSQLSDFYSQYRTTLLAILAQTPPRKLQVNAIRHIQGYFKKIATKDEKINLDEVINKYLNGRLSINAPLALLKQLLTQYPNTYLSEQYYLSPYPECEHIRALN
ncbi:YbgA family protein [Providencia sneebia]|nr:DUF1722 domain-containing protein [Providencia sneebia]